MKIHTVTWVNPNNVIYTEPRKFVTTKKSELTKFLLNARKYSGSYDILSVEETTGKAVA